MVRVLIVAAIAMTLGGAELRIDHVTVAGRDLKRMQESMAALGLRTEYGGPHSNRATEMALIAFPDGSYLELIALQNDADHTSVASHTWARWMENDAGPCAWAVRVKNMDEEVKRLRGAGIPVSAPVRSGRERPDGVRLGWETAQVGPEPNGTFFPFLIRDLTPREQRASPNGKPQTKDFGGILKVVIAVRNLDAAAKRFRQAYGLEAPLKQVDAAFGAHLGLLGGSAVILAAPLTSQSWLADRIERFGEGPCAFILSARKAGAYKTASKTRWFAADISWFDSEALGWWLGFQ